MFNVPSQPHAPAETPTATRIPRTAGEIQRQGASRRGAGQRDRRDVHFRGLLQRRRGPGARAVASGSLGGARRRPQDARRPLRPADPHRAGDGRRALPELLRGEGGDAQVLRRIVQPQRHAGEGPYGDRTVAPLACS